MRDFFAVGSLTFLQSDLPQEEKRRLCTRHSPSQTQNTLVFEIQPFYPVRGIDHPLHLGRIGQISEVGDVALVLEALKRRVALALPINKVTE